MAETWLLGALHTPRYHDRIARCRETWAADAKRLGVDVVFLVGAAPTVREPVRDGDILLLPCPDDYLSLPQRTMWFCRWALTQQAWTRLGKLDDDTYVSIPRMIAYEPSGEYCGAEWKSGVGYGSGGALYMLSRRAAAVVAENLTMPTGAEDLLVGQVLNRAGIPLSIEPRFIPYVNETHRPKLDNDLITAHAISGELFLKIHRELSGDGSSSP